METRRRKKGSLSDNTNASNSSDKKDDPQDKGRGDVKNTTEESTMMRLCGFDSSDFTSWTAFVKLMNRPSDPASLAATRILFGILMLLDSVQERGLAYADSYWGDQLECRFPLFNFLEPLELQWMYVTYLCLIIGALGIVLGACYRLSCLMFVIPYWYIFFLDKTSWNNHSYLYGLCGILLLITDSNRMWSIDGLFRKGIRHSHVPLWNYTLFRAQFFLVYFIAGIKKLDADWVMGYSMQKLASHWVFTPFKFVLTDDQVDLLVVHQGGLIIDLSIGYLLFFDITRPLGMIMGASFHLMNSQIFSIGMFPYTMLATMPLFCHTDWPRKLIRKLPLVRSFINVDGSLQGNTHCVYTKQQVQAEKKENKGGSCKKKSGLTLRHHLTSILAILYVSEQIFMPYSHFLTKGYNNWTKGLYGYSWDMMVHSWSTQHVRITYTNLDTGDVGYLNPQSWTTTKRWSSHADMMKQYGTCISNRLQHYNISNVEVRFDIWRSLNDRFQQRMFDPRVDLVKAEWHPLKHTPWLMPLLTDLSDWRGKLTQIEKTIFESDNDTDVVFIADFPGLWLENYVQPDLGNTTIEVLHGEVMVEVKDEEKNTTLKKGEKMQLPAGQYHNVHTVSDTPSCYMYLFVNTTEKELTQNILIYEQELQENKTEHNSSLDNETYTAAKNAYIELKQEAAQHNQSASATLFERLHKFAIRKYLKFKRAAMMTWLALKVIYNGQTHEDLMKHAGDVEKDMLDEEVKLLYSDEPDEVTKEVIKEKYGIDIDAQGDNIDDDTQDMNENMNIHSEAVGQS